MWHRFPKMLFLIAVVEFSGKFPSTNPKILAITISGEGKTAELPIVYTPISKPWFRSF